MRPVIRYARLRCATPTVQPIHHEDDVLAVAAIKESVDLAHPLLVDMGAWGRNTGASVTDAADALLHVAHRQLIAGFGVSRPETLAAELDSSGHVGLIVPNR